MSTKQELRDQIAAHSERARVWRAKANALGRELAATKQQRDDALAALTELRQADEPTTPTPRPFRVGDRVRVAEGATYHLGLMRDLPSRAAGRVAVVREVWSDGDLILDAEADSECAAAPEFCTLIEDEPEPERVTLTLADGTRIEFDAVVNR